MDHGPQGETAAERSARMATHLRDMLQLQPAQEPALEAWLAALKPPEGEMDAHHHEGADEAATTPERLDGMLAHLDRMRARMAQVADATKRFYAQLTPAQQKAFDALSPMMMRHMGGRGMGDGAMHDHPGPDHDDMGPRDRPPG